ncbi:MAG: hypothetical protein F6J95_024725 [Leptolyngbya sp. SIO1E4]|nr:hypothetical protein [Leptolyngbya sp. SIO1E4]
MNPCCCPPASPNETSFTCPGENNRGKLVQLMTLKSLLTPPALERLEPQGDYRFCDAPNCPVVYFSNQGNTFTAEDLKAWFKLGFQF